MKILAVICIAIVLMSSLMAQQCGDGNICNPLTHCCINFGVTKNCIKKGTDGESCGGAVRCSDCVLPNVCVENERTITQVLFTVGTGTCKGPGRLINLKK
ncbi:hypothetical protein CHUAL_010853 [Chamberlinius hualienensis]